MSISWSYPCLRKIDELEDEVSEEQKSNKEKENELDTKSNYRAKNNDKPKSCFDNQFCGHISLIISLFYFFGMFTFISSMCYYFESNKTRKRWDNIIMAEFIFFKIIDMNLLSYFDFFDNTDF